MFLLKGGREDPLLLKGGREDPLLLKGGRSGHASFVGFSPLKKIVSLRMGGPT